MIVFLATLAVTALLYIYIPKGFFPVQDTGLIQGISEASQNISYAAMADRQETLAEGGADGPRCREPDLVHRGRRHQPDAQQRPLPDQSQAEGRARFERQRRDPPAQSRDREHPGRHAVHAAGPGPYHRFDDLQDAVPIRARGRQSDRADELDSAPRREIAATPSDRRRRQQYREQRALGLYHRRSRHRGAFRHHHGNGGQRALRRFRPADRLDLFHPNQPVSRHPRSQSGFAGDAGSRSARSICRRRRPAAPPTARARCRCPRSRPSPSSRRR